MLGGYILGPWHEYELSKAIFRSELPTQVSQIRRYSKAEPSYRKSEKIDTNQIPKSSRSGSVVVSSRSVQDSGRQGSSCLTNTASLGRNPKKSSVVRLPNRNRRESAGSLEKLVSDRIDSWTKMYSNERMLSRIPPVPENIDSFPDESTLIDWGTSLDFTKLIATLSPTD
jgi:hypothetical protein